MYRLDDDDGTTHLLGTVGIPDFGGTARDAFAAAIRDAQSGTEACWFAVTQYNAFNVPFSFSWTVRAYDPAGALLRDATVSDDGYPSGFFAASLDEVWLSFAESSGVVKRSLVFSGPTTFTSTDRTPTVPGSLIAPYANVRP